MFKYFYSSKLEDSADQCSTEQAETGQVDKVHAAVEKKRHSSGERSKIAGIEMHLSLWGVLNYLKEQSF